MCSIHFQLVNFTKPTRSRNFYYSLLTDGKAQITVRKVLVKGETPTSPPPLSQEGAKPGRGGFTCQDPKPPSPRPASLRFCSAHQPLPLRSLPGKQDKGNPFPTEAILRMPWRNRETNRWLQAVPTLLNLLLFLGASGDIHTAQIQRGLRNIKPHTFFFFFFFDLEQCLGKSTSNWDTN